MMFQNCNLAKGFLLSFFLFYGLKSPLQATNKEEFFLMEENFSDRNYSLNIIEIQKNLRYSFTNPNLLIDSLYHLLPRNLQNREESFNNLEFLGDSVLGLLVIKRLIKQMPDNDRGMNNILYQEIICNKNLTKIYFDKLQKSIEKFIPYPGNKKCKYCNVVEAIIGAIFTDDEKRGLINSESFIHTIIDHQDFIRLLEDALNHHPKKPHSLRGVDSLKDSVPSVLKKAIEEDIRDNNPLDSKSILSRVLQKYYAQSPSYTLSFGVNDNFPVFVACVRGAEIGSIEGIGSTPAESERAAASNAINQFAQREIFPPNPPLVESYQKFVTSYFPLKKIRIVEQWIETGFISQATNGDQILGEGRGKTKKDARNKAIIKAGTNTEEKKYTIIDMPKIFKFLLRASYKNNEEVWEEEIQQEGTIREKLEEIAFRDIFYLTLRNLQNRPKNLDIDSIEDQVYQKPEIFNASLDTIEVKEYKDNMLFIKNPTLEIISYYFNLDFLGPYHIEQTGYNEDGHLWHDY